MTGMNRRTRMAGMTEIIWTPGMTGMTRMTRMNGMGGILG